jgi:hypothetical protein
LALTTRGIEQLAARKAHNLEVPGSSPGPATTGQLTFTIVRPSFKGRPHIVQVNAPLQFTLNFVHSRGFQPKCKLCKIICPVVDTNKNRDRFCPLSEDFFER